MLHRRTFSPLTSRSSHAGKKPQFAGLLALALAAAVALLMAACGTDAGGNATEANRGASGTSAPVDDVTTSEPGELVRDDSWVIGPQDAPVTIVEFLDPECEYCRAAYPDVKRLLSEYPDDLRLVIRYFPLHGNSILAVQATEAAGEQGKYAEMHELLFARQTEWGEQETSQEELFMKYAGELGLDVEQFSLAMQDPKYAQKAERDQADGIALGVRGTPTFFVNGEWISDPSYGALKAAIVKALE